MDWYTQCGLEDGRAQDREDWRKFVAECRALAKRGMTVREIVKATGGDTGDVEDALFDSL